MQLRLNKAPVALAVLVLLAGGCAHCQKGRRGGRVFSAAGRAALSPPVMEAAPDWPSCIEATGRGFAAPGASDPARRKMTAVAAAKCRTLAELAELVRGLHLQSRSNVADLRFAGESIETEVQADLAQVRLVASQYDEDTGMAQVTMRMGLSASGEVLKGGLSAPPPPPEGPRRQQAERVARKLALQNLKQALDQADVVPQVALGGLAKHSKLAARYLSEALEKVEYSPARWHAGKVCTVQAEARIAQTDWDMLQILAR